MAKNSRHSKDEFITVVSHEIKTPLTHIIGFSNLLQRKQISENAKLRSRYLNIISNESKRLSSILTKMLSLSKFDTGTFKFCFETISVYDLVLEAKRKTCNGAKKKNIMFVYKVDDKIPDIVADKQQLEEILIILLENAIEHTSKGYIELRVSKEKKYMLFSVKDTGIGIPKKHLGKIFERFYQVEPVHTRHSRGCGLGLALCKKLVEGMGGKIWVESKAGKGSTFYFTIPYKTKFKSGKT